MKGAICLLVLILGQPNEEPGEKVSETQARKERYLRAMDAALNQEISRVEHRIKRGREDLREARRRLQSIKKNWKKRNKGRKKDKVKLKDSPAHKACLKEIRDLTSAATESKKRLRKLKKGEVRVLPRLSGFKHIEVGQIGAIAPFASLRVFQVLGDDEMLVEGRREATRRSDNGMSLIYTGVMVQDGLALFRGVSTKGLVRERVPEFGQQVFEVTGTSTYRTAAGRTNTVFVLEPFKFDWAESDQDSSKPSKKSKKSKKKSKGD